MELFIIRHGQSFNNALGVEGASLRHKDPALTAIGEKQAACVAPFLAAGGHLTPGEKEDRRPAFDELYCSPMLRALQTAAPIGRELDLAPEVWVDIHEAGGIFLDHGEVEGVVGYPGQTRREILERFPAYVLPAEVGQEGWWNQGFEELHRCHGRAIGVATTLLERAAEDRRIGLVSHGGFMDALMKAFGQQLPGNGLHYLHHNTAITRIDFVANGRTNIRYMNRVDHLPQEWLT